MAWTLASGQDVLRTFAADDQGDGGPGAREGARARHLADPETTTCRASSTSAGPGASAVWVAARLLNWTPGPHGEAPDTAIRLADSVLGGPSSEEHWLVGLADASATDFSGPVAYRATLRRGSWPGRPPRAARTETTRSAQESRSSA